MTVSCPECRSVFRVDPTKVPATGVRARCSVCGGVIAISAGTLQISVTPSSTGIVTSGNGSPTPQRPFTPPLAPRAIAPQSLTPRAPQSPPAPPAPMRPAATMTPPMPSRLPSYQDADTPIFPTPSISSHSPAPAMPAPTVQTPAMPAVAPPSSDVPAVGMPTPAAGRRPINPFLNADPGQRARRLARALVSDLVAYHPQKRDEGLKDGTLRQRFRDEIKKSYEEYVEQVGREIADGTPHFQDALNDILGGGRKLF